MGNPTITIKKITPKTGEAYFQWIMKTGNGRTPNHKYNSREGAEEQAEKFVQEMRNKFVRIKSGAKEKDI